MLRSRVVLPHSAAMAVALPAVVARAHLGSAAGVVAVRHVSAAGVVLAAVEAVAVAAAAEILVAVVARPAVAVARPAVAVARPADLGSQRVPSEAPGTLEAAQKGGFLPAGGNVGTLADVRAKFGEELKDPAVRERFFQLTAAENPQNPEAFMESVMNRANARGQTLQQAMNDRAYYPGVSVRGKDPGQYRGSMEKAIGGVLGGSNITNYATGNASLNVGFGYGKGAADPYTYKTPNNERYGIENKRSDINWVKSMRQAAAGAPPDAGGRMTLAQIQAAVRGGGGGGGGGGDLGSLGIVDSTKLSSRGYRGELKEPKAIISHYTGGSTLSGAISTLNSRGLAYNYIVDKDGTIHQFAGGRGAHMLPGSGPAGEGLGNANTIGISAVGSGEKDMMPAQVQSMRNLTAALGKAHGIPPSQVFGHGQVNPGHREADEGQSTFSWAQGLRDWPSSDSTKIAKTAAPSGEGTESAYQKAVDAGKERETASKDSEDRATVRQSLSERTTKGSADVNITLVKTKPDTKDIDSQLLSPIKLEHSQSRQMPNTDSNTGEREENAH